jgi:hypothetical protein
MNVQGEERVRCSSTHFQDDTRSMWVVSVTLRPLFPGKNPVPILLEAKWTSGLQRKRRNILSPTEFDPGPSRTYHVAIPTELFATLNQSNEVTKCHVTLNAEMFAVK